MGRTTRFPNFIWHYTCVPGEIGIRRSKDLRAEIGKFPNSTNERKQMSTKTMRQRIALVAVSALTAGVLSVASAPVANAYTDITYGAATAIPVAGQMNIGRTPSTSGAITVDGGTAADLGKPNSMTSIGFVAKTSTTGTLLGTTALQLGDAASANGNDTTATAVVLAGAKLSVAVGGLRSAAGDGVSIVVSGGTLSGVLCYDDASAEATTLNGSATIAWCNNTGASAVTLGAAFNLSAAAGSTATISAYTGAEVNGTTTATAGVLIAQLTLTVAAASASGTYSAGDSSIYVQPGITAGATSSTVQAYDTASNLDNGAVGVIWVQTKDAYSAAVTGLLGASASAGNVAVTNGTVVAADSYSGSTTFGSQAVFDGDGYITVRQPTANTASTSVVTITLDGAVIATKTIKWNGVGTSISLVSASSASIFSNGYTATDTNATASARNLNVVYSVRDAAGNAINVADAATSVSISDQTGSMVGALLDQTDTSSPTTLEATAILQTTSLGYGVATMEIPASSLSGAGTYMLKYVNSAGATIKSAAINATVSAGAASFTASWDKAQYNTGDIATLTITAKDSKGQLVADGVVLGTGALVTTNTDGLASVTSACDSGNIATTTYSAGSKVCKFAVKNTAGSYAFTAKVATSADQAAATGTVKVVDGSGAVSNADVLKSIVALIASINKQIQALQKLILRR